MGDPMMMLVPLAGVAVSSLISLGMFMYKDSICENNPTFPLLCTVAPTEAPVTGGVTETATASAAPAGGVGAPGASLGKRFAPYLLLTNATISYIGTKSKWTTLAFVTGLSTDGKKLIWDSGATDITSIKAKVAAAKKAGFGVIVSFGGSSAGKKSSSRFAELAGKYTDTTKLADHYIYVADTVGTTWLDFDVEEAAITDSTTIDRRNKALAIMQKKRPDLRVSFTVPVLTSGLETATKNMLTKAKNAGVKITCVNLMVMYFTKSKVDMADAAWKAMTASKPFIKLLDAKIGLTPLIGKNPDKPYTHETFTVANAKALYEKAKKDDDVIWLGMWSLNADVKSHGNKYAAEFKYF